MKNTTVMILGCGLLALGCGSAKPQPVNEPQTTLSVTSPATVTTTEAITVSKEERQAPILRTSGNQQQKCGQVEQEDGTKMVVSDDKDWFLYVPQSADVSCASFSGDATMTDGNTTIMVKALIPRDMEGREAEKMLRQQTAQFVKNGLSSQWGKVSLNFEETKIGKSKRPALCATGDLDMKGVPGKVVACVTAKTNADGEVVVHRVVWVGADSDFDDKQTEMNVKTAASSWYRYSDTDGMGKLLVKW